MREKKISNIADHFKDLKDPRRITSNRRHKFIDVIVIAICGIISNADDWVSIERYGKAKKSWLKKFLELPHGIPTHDTFNDIFSKLSTSQFQECFSSWVSSIIKLLPDEVVAIDGKTLRHSYDNQDSKAAIHMVSAWASKNSLVLGQIKTEEKSNEITAIPELLKSLDIHGCLVTIDAMGCQKKIAETIVEQGGAYILGLKQNQPKLYSSVEEHFETASTKNFKGYDIDYDESLDRGHGREEKRKCWVCYDLDFLNVQHKWKDLRSVIMIESERKINGKVSLEYRYYISSTMYNAESLLKATRDHWSIENSLHWILDVAFREDECRIRKGNGAENMAILRHIALNLLKNEKTAKVGIKNKRLMAGWDMSYLEKVLKLICA